MTPKERALQYAKSISKYPSMFDLDVVEHFEKGYTEGYNEALKQINKNEKELHV